MRSRIVDASLMVRAGNDAAMADRVTITAGTDEKEPLVRLHLQGRDGLEDRPIVVDMYLTRADAETLAEDLLKAKVLISPSPVLRHRACGGKIGEVRPDGPNGATYYGHACQRCQIPVQRENCYESDA